jgi:molecular chaperone HscA
VTFQVDADGLLNVEAKELSTGVESSIQVKPSYGLNDTQIADMLKASYSSAEDDKEKRLLREQIVDADRLIAALEQAIVVDGQALLSDDERALFESEIALLKSVRDTSDTRAIELGVERLAKVSDDFASRRMDLNIQRALQGHSIKEIEEIS